MFEPYVYQMEALISEYVIHRFNNDDLLMVYPMGNHNPSEVSPFNKIPYFGFALVDFSNLDDKDYIPREGKFCRISVLEPKILGIEDENFIPSKEHIELLYNWLLSPYKFEWGNNIETNESGWKELIDIMIREPGAYKVPVDLPMPNYMELITNLH